MRFRRCLMPVLVIAGSLSLVSACASNGSPSVIYPPSADLAIEPKPELKPADIYSEAALDAHDIAIEARGDRLADQIGRICRFYRDLGMDIECPPPKPHDQG